MQPQDYNTGIQPQAELASPQLQVIERLRTAVNVLVTVSNSPSVDQLAAAIAFTLLLNKMGKHATAVFSGDVPSTIEFLQPEQTIEKNTDSLRDFIVSLDKNKADKLRYKVEENVVKIFITPYKTSLSESDLNFSQGDFNVDAIVALGVSEREQLDQAIIAHGRILHDATVITVSAGQQQSSLGAINWQDSGASSLCEMLITAGDALQSGLLDGQIATAYLTGIVSKTERFRNEHTTPKIMTIAAQLMAAGANQQLIAASLEKGVEAQLDASPVSSSTPEHVDEVPAVSNGVLTIQHNAIQDTPEPPVSEPEAPQSDTQTEDLNTKGGGESDKPLTTVTSHRLIEPLSDEDKKDNNFAGGLYAGPQPGNDDGMNEPNTDPLSANEPTGRILTHSDPVQPAAMPVDVTPQQSDAPAEQWGATLPDSMSESAQTAIQQPVAAPTPPEPAVVITPDPTIAEQPARKSYNEQHEILTLPPAMDDQTLHSIEKAFSSPHVAKDPDSTLDDIEESVRSPHLEENDGLVNALDAVQNALAAAPYDSNRPAPLQALNASPLDSPNPQQASTTTKPTSDDPVLAQLGLSGNDFQSPPSPQVMPPSTVSLPRSLAAPAMPAQSPPPVPPPLMTIR